MKFVLRVLGTWVIGLTIILMVIDGTKSLAANELVLTSLGDLWNGFDPSSYAAFRAQLAQWLEPMNVFDLASAVYSWPGWVMTGVIGIILLLLGRPRRQRGYVEPR